MKRMRLITLGLAGVLLLGLSGCHGTIVFDHPYYASCRPTRTTVTVYRRVPAYQTTTVYVSRPAPVVHSHGCR